MMAVHAIVVNRKRIPHFVTYHNDVLPQSQVSPLVFQTRMCQFHYQPIKEVQCGHVIILAVNKLRYNVAIQSVYKNY